MAAQMTISEAVDEWCSRKRRMGCVSASEWFCKRVKGFKPLLVERWTEDGDSFGHVICDNGQIRVDLTPHLDSADDTPSHL